MSSIVKGIKGLFGGGDDQLKAIRKAQKEQQAQLEAERKKLEAIEAGQARVRGGGGRGLLAFIEDKLGQTFGGA